MRIVFDPAALHQSKKGSITAVVYFEFAAGQQFPGLGWNDFVVVLAAWWVGVLHRVASGESGLQLRFMDGPYWITIIAQENRLLLQCIEDRRGAGVVYEFTTNIDDLTSEVLAFACRVSEACKAAAISSVDLDRLRAMLPN
ncbi:hypothetical protein ACQR1N_32100 [Bradyrhizobium sp. HKCCYLRH1073]|uniref:hypothetical protein n=1 Tax=unclassified Bradyrhizobium TaxID=2631580 RepID=UPI003EBFD54A